jgi:D-alanyl-D-alanine carboxypeptidase (penicillin-binding protein 5/6)
MAVMKVVDMRLLQWMSISGGIVFFLVGCTLGETEARIARANRQPAPTATEPALAQTVRRPTPRAAPTPSVPTDHPALPSSQTFQAVLLQDATTGQVLFAQNSEKQWPAASLTKMMVALLALEEIAAGRLSFYTPVVISKRANRAGGRTINLRPGEVFSLEALLQAMLVTSANDAAVAVAERVKGSVEACVVTMNRRARELGMDQTRYQTVNGMPPKGKTLPDVSSADDMAILAHALLKHAEVLQWTSLSRIPFRNGRIMLPNTNHLVGKVTGVDGLKTGYTNKARFNLVTTAQRDRRRLIAVVMGGQSSRIRFRIATTLLEWGFARFPPYHPPQEGERAGAGGKAGTLAIY